MGCEIIKKLSCSLKYDLKFKMPMNLIAIAIVFMMVYGMMTSQKVTKKEIAAYLGGNELNSPFIFIGSAKIQHTELKASRNSNLL